MGGTEKETDSKTTVMKNKEDISDAIISKLLNDFSSADLLTTGNIDSNSSAAIESAGYERIVSSLKHLHLRKPVNSRQKIKEKKKYSKRGKSSIVNKYNLSVAAVSSVERPVVWPGKLSNSSKKEDSYLLQPSRLSLGGYDERLSSPLPSVKCVASSSTLAEKARIENELRKQNMHQFGSLSGSYQSCPSFSKLSQGRSVSSKANTSGLTDAITDTDKCNNDSSSSLRAKKPSLYNEIYVSSDIAQCLDYRCHNSCYDNTNENCYSSFKRSGENTGHDMSSSQLNKPRSGSCSQDTSSSLYALSSCETTSCSYDIKMEESNVNELASYFDDLLYIPKKMSVMAEMMYA